MCKVLKEEFAYFKAMEEQFGFFSLTFVCDIETVTEKNEND